MQYSAKIIITINNRYLIIIKILDKKIDKNQNKDILFEGFIDDIIK